MILSWRVQALATLCVLTSILHRSGASALSSDATEVLRRLNTRDAVSCKAVDPSLPSNFTCSSDRQCISLDSSSSALCCPTGGNCTTIKTISCDVGLQDPSKNPNASVFTTRLNNSLPTCGNSCCPFGYNCLTPPNSDPLCSIILSTSKLNSTSSSTLSSSSSTAPSSSSSTSQSSSTSTHTALSSGIDSTTPQPQAACNKFPAGVFMAGFFPGILIGAFMMLGWVICSGRHRKPDLRNSQGSSIYSQKPVISEPIPLMSGGRTDFLRRTTTRAKSMFSAKNSPRTDSNPWKMPTPPVPNNVPDRPLGLPVTPTPRHNVVHQSSTESIKIYSPPSIVQPPNAAVAPLRGMATKRNNDVGFGSPFKTPPNANNGAPYESLASREHEVLTPQRYEQGSRARDEYNPRSRPETTFTDMMLNTGFEKPGNRPKMPPMPKGYETRI